MDEEIDIFEYQWLSAFTGYITFSVVSLMLIWLSYAGLQMVNEPISSYKSEAIARLFCVGGFGIIFLCASVIRLYMLIFIPKMIIFRQSGITVILAFRHEKVFSYQDISRLVIVSRPTKKIDQLIKSWSPFRAKLYFSDDSIKIIFNPDTLFNFPGLLVALHEKGLANVIKEK